MQRNHPEIRAINTEQFDEEIELGGLPLVGEVVLFVDGFLTWDFDGGDDLEEGGGGGGRGERGGGEGEGG